jgi:hypothetical protein
VQVVISQNGKLVKGKNKKRNIFIKLTIQLKNKKRAEVATKYV